MTFLELAKRLRGAEDRGIGRQFGEWAYFKYAEIEAVAKELDRLGQKEDKELRVLQNKARVASGFPPLPEFEAPEETLIKDTKEGTS